MPRVNLTDTKVEKPLPHNPASRNCGTPPSLGLQINPSGRGFWTFLTSTWTDKGICEE